MFRFSPNLFAALLLIVSLVVGVFVWQPLREGNVVLASDRDQKVAQLQKVESEIQRLTQLEASLPVSEVERARLLESVPLTLEQERLVTDLDRVAAEAKVSLNAMNFSLQGERANAKVVSMVANFTGGYDALLSLLQALETNVRLFKVSSIGVQVSEATEGTTPLMNFSVTLEAYYQ